MICAGVSSRDASALDFSSDSFACSGSKVFNGSLGSRDSGGGGYGSAESEVLTGEAVLTEASRLLANVKDGESLRGSMLLP